jgi:hypothetical protein
MNVASAVLWGFVATATMTTLMALAQGVGLTRMSLPFLLGTAFTPARDRALVVGGAAHFANGWLFSFLYAGVFEQLGRATWWIGAAGGLLHGGFVLAVLLPLLPGLHPRMVSEYYGPTPNRQLQPPGFLALHYGRRTPLVAMAAHVAYGAVLGAFYTPAG